ncbi:CdaR family protein [Ligilactobacillus faecis]|uniref:CdaR family protein n=1 Tax=Ligilactobacillus faecis TaxID=762833 RepID=A0ABV4DTN3_9LACO
MRPTKFWNTKAMYRLLSLVFALLLFFYVSYQRLGSTRVSEKEVADSSLINNKSLTLKVPLTLNFDSNKYYVSGYPEKVKVQVTGPNALVTALENTRNFEIYADLSELGPGTHKVKLKTSGFNKELSVALAPETIKVKIATKKTAKFPIQVRYDSGQIAKDHVAGDPLMSQQTVEITGAKSDVDRVESVVANLNLPTNIREAYSRTVLLQALDKKGTPLNVSLSPETVKVNLPISEATATKEVKLELTKENNGVPGKTYTLSTETKTVTLRGTRSALSRIKTFAVPVSVAGVNSSTTKTVELSPNKSGIAAVSPATIQVMITVSETEENSGTKAIDSNETEALQRSSSSEKATSSSASSTAKSSSEVQNETENSRVSSTEQSTESTESLSSSVTDEAN